MGGIKRKLLLSLLGSCAALAIAAPASQAALSWDETSYDFGSRKVGNPVGWPPTVFTLTATCDADAGEGWCTPAGIHNYGVVSVTGEGFALAEPNTCLSGMLVTPYFPSTAYCIVWVTFGTASVGTRTGSLNTQFGPDIALSGTATKKCKKGFKLKKGKCKRKKKKS